MSFGQNPKIQLAMAALPERDWTYRQSRLHHVSGMKVEIDEDNCFRVFHFPGTRYMHPQSAMRAALEILKNIGGTFSLDEMADDVR